MPNIYERPFPRDLNAPVRQFTSCCGASDKGCEGGVACRSCYHYIDDYYGVGEEEAFRATIRKPSMVKKFNEMLAEKYDTYDEWHDALMRKTSRGHDSGVSVG